MQGHSGGGGVRQGHRVFNFLVKKIYNFLILILQIILQPAASKFRRSRFGFWGPSLRLRRCQG